ncbi:tyrosinase family protein [Frateuria sp. STR12]|uniref:tyrosinase family protein n=1 Tax=Frateuria hangzhouensis TaxID=2995589 RepID=UPI002260F956|nr:tyrosinase family protein [Frateuria sp. STR12]MCX7512148.1 tyrosinase family protein [Frateuria sp. STR12]
MISRRRFLQSSVSLALVPLLPRVAMSAGLRIRPSWEVFCQGPTFASFCSAIASMKANKDNTDPTAWTYWSESHRQFCPHGRAYFLAWHRGFLYRFEGNLRRISGDPNLVLPYWNYYDSPTIPPEFLDPALPLYRGDRTGFDVSNANSMDAFDDTLIHFQRGKTDAFEPMVETRPHNRVHNLIGGAMSSIPTSPRDPLFWVHHANIDRLWAAWSKAGNGRRQPAASNIYWSGSFQFGSATKDVPRVWTTSTSANLGYQYDNETMPSATPPPPSGSTAQAAVFSLAGGLPERPASIQRAPLGVARPLALDERSISVDVPLSAQDANRVRSVMLAARTTAAATDESSPLRVVLDGVHLTGLGEKGGYFYDVYVNLPGRGGASAPPRAYLIGSIGAFEISVAQMKARMGSKGMQGMGMAMHAAHAGNARLVLPMADALRRIWPTQLDRLTISFVRKDGRKHPATGEVIRIKSFSVEAGSAM